MNRPRTFLTASLLAAPLLMLSTAAEARGAAYSAAELAELQKMSADLDRFRKAAASYRATVNSIVKRAYTERRKKMLGKYDKQILKYEAEERTRRIAAITLFEDFLRRYPNDRRWTPDVIFRLAELYFEKSNDEYLQASAIYDKDLKRFERKELATAPTLPKQDYTQTVSLHRRLIKEFPRYRLIDGAYYLLGYCLSEMGKVAVGNRALLALVCSNRYKVPLTDTLPAPATPPAAATDAPGEEVPPALKTEIYATCRPLKKKGRFNAEAWIRVGEHHFDENELGPAIAAYRRVLDLGPKKNAYYDEALYKLAWTYYRADKFTEAIAHFDKLVVFADKQRAKTGKAGSEMRPEAVQYLGISFSEEDWDGDGKPDGESGLQRIERVYAGRDKEKHVYEIYRRLGDIYFMTTKYPEAIAVYKVMLQRWPYRSDNPDIQDKIITALERQRSFEKAMSEREQFTKLFGKGSAWEKKNRNNAKALKKAREYDEQALIQAAVFHHKAGQDLRKRGLAMSNVDLLKRAAQEYAMAAKAYEKYLDRFPNTKNSYEIRFSYASCLFFSQRFLEAAKVYEKTRDSNLDNRYQEDAAFFAIKSYEEHIKILINEKKLTEPPLPTSKSKGATKMQMPKAYKLYQKALDDYARVLPQSAKTPRLSYKAAEISYRFVHFKDARKRFNAIYKKHCKDAMAVTAGQAILVTYQLEKKPNLDKLQEWAAKLASGKCGGKAAAVGKVKSGAAKLLDGIKFKRANALMKKADSLRKAGKLQEAAPYYDKAAAAFLKLVQSSPNSSDADKALFNAGVCYERSMRFESATRIYEKVWQQYKKSPLAGEALWLSAESYKRFFEFKRAVTNYLILADAQRFSGNSHRTDAIYNAALILENDQAYTKAAALFLRYAKQAPTQKDAAEAYFRAGLIYGKMNNFSQMVKVLRAFPDKYGSVDGQITRAVEAMYRIAKTAHKRGIWNTAKKYYKSTMSQYSIRGAKPASDAAEYAAEAAFRLTEVKLQKYLKINLKKLSLKQLVRKQKAMSRSAIALKREYGYIIPYKRARWTLAALFRYGTIYEHFAKQVSEGYRTSPIPKKVRRLGQDAVDIYQERLDQALENEVAPLEKETKRLYKECVDRAKSLGVSNQYTEEAARRLNALDPGAYPLLKRAKTGLIEA